MTTTEELLASILNKPAICNTRDRDNVIPQRENNSITKELNNLKLNNLKLNNSTLSREGEDMSALAETSSSLVSKPQKAFVSMISGIEVQMKAAREHRQHAYITLQTHDQLVQAEAMNYTAYLVGRERAREFKRLNAFDEEVYQYTVENKHLLIAHLSERGTKRLLNDIVITYDPEISELTLWFNDYSGVIAIPTTNKQLTASQERYFISAGAWGQPIQLPGHDTRSFLDCTSRVGGRK